MAGNNELDNAVLGGTADYLYDLGQTVSKIHHAKEEDKATMMAEVKEKTLPNMLGVLQKNVKNGHFIGSEKLSWVDILGYWYLEGLKGMVGFNLADYPVLQKLHDDVAAQPNIKKWLETGPKDNIVGGGTR
ncbi:uncharacterized protein [Dysidea avara]|uniref:uncharacterized protein n=1 Tax=Dysidea avara TaxID=196820 RepID=UPI00331CA274